MAGKSVRDQCRHLNQSTAGLYELYAPLRQRLTALATASIRPIDAEETVAPAGTLAVPGAGNCNDLDLPQLSDTFERVDLIDLDGEALQHALKRDFGDNPPDNLQPIAGVDLTGLGKRPRNAPPVPEKSIKFVTRLARHRPEALPRGQYDRVASSNMVGATIGNLAAVMTGKHKLFAKAALAVRDAHIQQLIDMLKPGGFGVIVLELVSSDIVPELGKWNTRQLLPAFDRIVRQGPMFPGAHPEQIGRVLVESKQVTAMNGLAPWRFALGRRVYLMYGLTFLKKKDDERVIGDPGAAGDHQIIDAIEYRDAVSRAVTPADEQGLLKAGE
jgi:hypothetical protein